MELRVAHVERLHGTDDPPHKLIVVSVDDLLLFAAVSAAATAAPEAAYTKLLDRLLAAGSRPGLPKEVTVGAAVRQLLSGAALAPGPEDLRRGCE